MSSFWENLLGGAVAGAGAYDQYNRLTSMGQDIADDMGTLGQQLQNDTAFQPWTLASSVGSTSAGPDGMTMQLSDQGQAWQNAMQDAGMSATQQGHSTNVYLQQLAQDPARAAQTLSGHYTGINNYADNAFSTALGAMQNAGGDITGMQNDIYNQLRASQTPEEDRARLAMEERLAAQGRLGVQTSAYGGTPEALALEKAIGENRNAAFANAFNQAQQYQQNQLATAMGLGNQGYAGNQLAQQLASMNVQDINALSNTGMNALGQGAQAAGQLGQASMLPASLLADYAGVGLNNAQLGQQGQLAGASLAGQLNLGGAQIQTNMEQIANEMLASLWGNAAGIAGGVGSQIDSEGFSGFWDSLFGGS